MNLHSLPGVLHRAVFLLILGGAAAALDAADTPSDPPFLGYSVVRAMPHDTTAFTEGLAFSKGLLIESTGLNGRSSLRKVEIETGRVLQQVRLPDAYFGEGATVLGDRIYQLTWKSNKGFIYDLGTLAPRGEFTYAGEGWGLTTDGKSLIMSDGTNRIRFMDPSTFHVTRTIEVLSGGAPVTNLNELEYVKGVLYANVWMTKFILRIDPENGRILAWIDFDGLLPASETTRTTDVMNGIAYDAEGDRLFVTGKNWPRLYEVRIP
jgi:glutaminyl-peptide cyclotransferase